MARALLSRHGWPMLALASLLVLDGVVAAWTPGRQEGGRRDVSVVGSDFSFEPSRIEVQQDDVVKITFTARDLAHSFTIDSYRIARRAGAGQTVVIEFRADQAGTFPFYCNLTTDARCRGMRGELVVRPRE